MKLLVYSCFLGWLVSVTFAGYQGSTTVGNYLYEYYAGHYDDVDFCSALMKCLRIKGDLAMSKSETINSELNDLVTDYAWLGAHDVLSENDWYWIDGDLLKWENWGPSEPNDLDGEDCLLLTTHNNGIWYDENCALQYGYVCQFPLDQVTTFDNSQLTFHKDMKSFGVAQDECAKMGARIAQIETDDDATILSEKINRYEAEGARYWIAKTNGNDDVCQVLGTDGLEQYQCGDAAFGMICETARPHKVRVSDEHSAVVQSGYLEIDCTASGYPVPDVNWYKNDKVVNNQSRGDAKSRLLIAKASPDDAGRYVCVASNEINGKRMTAKGVSYISVT